MSFAPSITSVVGNDRALYGLAVGDAAINEGDSLFFGGFALGFGGLTLQLAGFEGIHGGL